MNREMRTAEKPRVRSTTRAAKASTVPVIIERDSLLANSLESAMTIRSQIETAAYYRAEKRGFEPGHELEDWLCAEAEIAARTERPPTTLTLSETMSKQTRSVS